MRVGARRVRAFASDAGTRMLGSGCLDCMLSQQRKELCLRAAHSQNRSADQEGVDIIDTLIITRVHR